jgi:hypothetical protein
VCVCTDLNNIKILNATLKWRRGREGGGEGGREGGKYQMILLMERREGGREGGEGGR